MDTKRKKNKDLQLNFDLKKLWSQPKWRFRIIFTIVWIIIYGSFMIWLQYHPEYTQIDPTAIVYKGNEIFYIYKDCPKDTQFYPLYKIEECSFTIGSPPPAYYIYKWYLKLRPYILWAGSIYIIGWIILNRKLLKRWANDLDTLVNYDQNDKKPKRRNNNR